MPTLVGEKVSPGVTIDDVRNAVTSAQFWAEHINLYSNEMQTLADKYAIAASLLSTITGLAAWGTIAASTKWWGQVLVGLMAFAAAAVAIIPKFRHYNECAVSSEPLAGEYAECLGPLRDAEVKFPWSAPSAKEQASEALLRFQAVKQKKDRLRPFPVELQRQINSMRK